MRLKYFFSILLLIVSLNFAGCGGGSTSGGTSGTGGGTSNPPPAPTETLYATGFNSVMQYSIDTQTGVPTFVKAVPGGGFFGIAISPSNDFLFASDSIANGVDAFSMGSTGTLSPVSGSPFVLPSSPAFNIVDSLAMDPAGKFLYAPDDASNQIVGFTISNSGGLTPIPGSPFSAGIAPQEIAIDPSGKFLYQSEGDAGISGFTIDSSTGTLTLISGSPFQGSTSSTMGLAFHPSGKFLYAVVPFLDLLAGYSIDTNTGVLTSLPGSPFSFFAPTELTNPLPYSLTIDSAGKFLYLLGSDSHVFVFAIDPDTGNLTEISGSPFGISSVPSVGISLGFSDLVIDPSGKFLYAGSAQASGLLGFSIDSQTGAVTPLPALFFGLSEPHLGFAFPHP